jgi:hypothetical protein
VVEPAGSLVTTCASGRFEFVVRKTADGTYQFAVVQTRSGMPSAPVGRTWVRDATAPDTELAASPDALNHRIDATFTVSSPDPTATFECAVLAGDSADGASYSACTSPVSFSSLPTGQFTFAARARDAAGNIDPSPVTFTWMQQTLFTIALYHLDAADPTADSSLLSGAPLVDAGTSAVSPGRFGDARAFPSAGATMTAPDAVEHDALTGVMSVEGWVYVETVAEPSATGIAAKSDGGSGKAWRLALEAAGGKHKLAFGASLDGTNEVVVRSGAMDLTVAAWHHVAATWNRGAVTLYVDGVQQGSGLVGTPGVARLFAAAAPIVLGGGNGGFRLDDVRVSQGARWSAAFPPPAAAYTAD